MKQEDKARRLAAATAVARQAGGLALGYFRALDQLPVERKGPQDVVSQADRAVETLIHDQLIAAFPDDAFFGEEHGFAAAGSSAAAWVVDPIDGTACFLAGIPSWCVSIACLIDDEIDIGVVYDPCCDALFSARRGGGAHLDGVAIRVSKTADLGHGSVGLGFSHRVAPDTVVDVLRPLLDAQGMYFNNGSGALMLAYVAAGRLLAYYEPHINAWDCLAGLALVREAGGWINDFLADDGLARGNPILAAAPGVATALRRMTGMA